MTAEAKAGSLMSGLPAQPLAEEVTQTLLERPGLRIERIVSTGHATPEGQWYDQDSDEWVLVVRGNARLHLEGEAHERELGEGDFVFLPAHCRHRVAWTQREPPTVWLAISHLHQILTGTAESDETTHSILRRTSMAGQDITRDQLADLLNEDLSREYQAIIAYVVYSQVLKGAEYMNIAAQLEEHAHQELQHALTISRQIDYLGKMPSVTPKPVKTSDKPRDMLKFDLDNENLTILNYQERIRQCEALSEFAMAEQIREILVQEQDHQIDLATALGEDVPDVSKLRKRKS